MNNPWIETQLTKSDEFCLRIVEKADNCPSAFRILPIQDGQPKDDGPWAGYPIDGTVRAWVKTSHPEATELYKDILFEKKEEAMTTALTVQEKENLAVLLKQNAAGLKAVLPDGVKPQKVMRMSYQLIVKNPELVRKCTPDSLMSCIIEAASINLDVTGPLALAHITPRKGKAVLDIDYKGEIDLMYRSPLVAKVVTNPVYRNDEFDYEYGSNAFLKHRPTRSEEKGPLEYAYVQVFFTNGENDFFICDKVMANAAKNHSEAKESKHSPWNKEDQVHHMWIKTAVHRIYKRIPKAHDLQKIVAIQESQNTQNNESAFDSTIDAEFTRLYEKNGVQEQPQGKEPEETAVITPQAGDIDVETEKIESMENETTGHEQEKDEPPEPDYSKLSEDDRKAMLQLNEVMRQFEPEYLSACKKLGIVPGYAAPKDAKKIIAEVNRILDEQAV